MNTQPIALEVVDTLTDAVADGRWDDADVEIEILTEEVVSALVHGRHEVTAAVAPGVERLYSRLRVRADLDGEGKVVTGQLRELTTLLSLALRHRRAPAKESIVTDERYRPILIALFHAPRAMTGRDLAEQIGTAEETMARKLPFLRGVGLVAHRKAGRATLNELTPEGRRLVESVLGADAPLAEAVFGERAEDLVKLGCIAAALVIGGPPEYGAPPYKPTVVRLPADRIVGMEHLDRRIGVEFFPSDQQTVAVTLKSRMAEGRGI